MDRCLAGTACSRNRHTSTIEYNSGRPLGNAYADSCGTKVIFALIAHGRRSGSVTAHVTSSDLRNGRARPDSRRDSTAPAASISGRPVGTLARPEVRAIAEGV